MLYRLIMWKRRWFGFAPQRYYIVERINNEAIAANNGDTPMSWLTDLMPHAWVLAVQQDYRRDQTVYLWIIR